MTMALQARQLQVQRDARTVLGGVDVSIASGRWTCVLGPNGAGKSTLLQALAGLLPYRGQVCWQGIDLADIPRRTRARQLAWLGQNDSAASDLHVWDVVMLGRLPHQAWWAGPSPEDTAQVQAALQAQQLWDQRDCRLQTLSAGQQQRVLLARALATGAPMVLMDEPLANLDPPHQVQWLKQVRGLTAQGTTVVSVLHEVSMALHADEVIVLDRGRIVHRGACSAAESHKAIEQVFAQSLRILAVNGQWAVLPRCG